MENNQVLKSFLNESFINVSNVDNINYFVKWEEFNLYNLNFNALFKIIFKILFKTNKDFSWLEKYIQDDEILKLFESTLYWETTYLSIENWDLKYTKTNPNNRLIGWNSINITKIIKKLLSQNILNFISKKHSRFQLLKYSDLLTEYEQEKEKEEMNKKSWRALYELIKIFSEIDKMWSNS